MKTLNVIVPDLPDTLSLSIYESEIFYNSLVIQAMVGNLVISDNTGRILPSLAISWENRDNLIWTFNLRSNLYCENDEIITVEKFKRSIERSIKWQSKSHKVPVFEKLNGYEEFVTGFRNDISGIKVKENQIIFNFKKPVKSGLLEYLAMAPYGFLSDSNFDNNLNWINDKKFISSGPYKISNNSSSGKLILTKNLKWYNQLKSAPDQVVIKNNTKDISDKMTLVITTGDKTEFITNSLVKLERVPEYLYPIILSTNRKSIFNDHKIRRLFQYKLYEILQNKKIDLPQTIISPDFYLHQQFFETNKIPYDKIQLERNHKVKFRGNPKTIKNPIKKFVADVLVLVLNELNLDYEIDETPITNIEDYFSEKYDVYMIGAEVGGGLEAWIAEMLFCSKIGPRYPDPTGNICKLIEDYDLDKIDLNQFTKLFNQQYINDAAVFPVLHSGRVWHGTSDIIKNNISPVVSIPRYEEIQLNE